VLFLKLAIFQKKHVHLFANRDRFGIIANMLIEAKSGLNKTQLVHCCNLNWRQLLLYLDFLLINNLISKEVDFDGSEKFVTTQKGNFFVKEFICLQALME
jgi:predicted transcriptional regulator